MTSTLTSTLTLALRAVLLSVPLTLSLAQAEELVNDHELIVRRDGDNVLVHRPLALEPGVAPGMPGPFGGEMAVTGPAAEALRVLVSFSSEPQPLSARGYEIVSPAHQSEFYLESFTAHSRDGKRFFPRDLNDGLQPLAQSSEGPVQIGGLYGATHLVLFGQPLAVPSYALALSPPPELTLPTPLPNLPAMGGEKTSVVVAAVSDPQGRIVQDLLGRLIDAASKDEIVVQAGALMRSRPNAAALRRLLEAVGDELIDPLYAALLGNIVAGGPEVNNDSDQVFEGDAQGGDAQGAKDAIQGLGLND